jgi:acetyltransferase-like isoleucine patch superfamily enzyme
MKDGLEKSILSLINQSQRENVEFIVIDGLSNDGSKEVIDQYREYIDKMVVERDTGIFDAMNKGIDLATGEYIYFLNSGDQFASNDVLDKVINFIDADCKQSDIYSGDVATFRFSEFIGIADLSPWIVHQSAFVKSSILKSYKFDAKFKVFGDLDLWTRLEKDNKFTYKKIDITVANMELDGVGSNPKYIFKRLKDKKYYAIKHKKYYNFLFSFVSGVIGFSIFKVFGEKSYYHAFPYVVQNVKKILSKPYWAIRKSFNFIYSVFSYPIYKFACKNFSFGSFIHPFASIGNHNLLSIGKNVEVNHNVTIWGSVVDIGNNSQINPNTVIYGNVKIGQNVMIAPSCMLSGGNHSFSKLDVPMRYQGSTSKGIIIEDNVWIGANSVVNDGITIGTGTVIGAGSVVTKSIPAYSVAVGNPCSVIKRRSE